MATIKAFIRTSVKKADTVNVRFRLTDGRDIQLFYKSGIQVSPSVWDEKTQCIKAKVVYDAKSRARFNNDIACMKNIIMEIYNQADKGSLDSKELARLIDTKLNPQKHEKSPKDFYALLEEYPKRRNLSRGRTAYCKTLANSMERYERIRSITDRREISKAKTGDTFRWDIDKIDPETLEDYEYYLHHECEILKEYPEMTQFYTWRTMPRPKGNNGISAKLTCLRAFLNWCYDQGLTTNNAFTKFKKKSEERYGTPYYLTLEERNRLADFDLSFNPAMERQRDIFIFQCLIGCRVSDLFRLTPDNIINDAIEYIPSKTRGDRPTIVRVPLNDRAKNLIELYKGVDRKGRLFPFCSTKFGYNTAIKKIFEACKVNRMVTVLNRVTGEEEKRPIYEIASSHIARRTFVGNLYKKVKDPNLVGALSGHRDGSRAFARYREIDEDIKKELVKMIE